MTDKLFFDTDCISAFLWVKEENILFKLYPGKIILPKPVFSELSNPSIPHIKRKINELCLSGDVSTKEILVNTEEYKLYCELAISPPKGEKVIIIHTSHMNIILWTLKIQYLTGINYLRYTNQDTFSLMKEVPQRKNP